MTEYKEVFRIGKPRATQHRHKREELLWLLAVATEKELPLMPLLAAQADQHGSIWQIYLHNLMSKLEQGLPLVRALAEVPGLLPSATLTTIQLGETSGTVAASLKEAAQQYSQINRSRRNERMRTTGYFFVVMIVTLWVFGFFSYYILPKMTKIYEDFGTELPAVTTALIKVGDVYGQYFYLWKFLIISLIILWYAVLKRIVLRKWYRVFIPPLLRNLAIAVDAQRPLPEVISTLARSEPDKVLSRQLLFVRNEIHQGDTIWNSLTKARVLTSEEAAILDSAQRADNLPWALRELARTIRRRSEYKLDLFFEWMRPLLIILLGLLVGFICVAMFVPLIHMFASFT